MYTVIASYNCLAKGVDHCLNSVEDHRRLGKQYAHLEGTATLRAQLRAANDRVDLIKVSQGLTVPF
jgi:hypothetical protein